MGLVLARRRRCRRGGVAPARRAADRLDGADDATAADHRRPLSGQPWILWVGRCRGARPDPPAGALHRAPGPRPHLDAAARRVGLAEQAPRPEGRSTIDAKVAEQVLEEALSHDPAIVAVDVTAFEIRRQNVLRVTAHTRRGVSPVQVRRSIDTAVSRWDALLGEETPVVIQIVSGLRTRLASTTRVA